MNRESRSLRSSFLFFFLVFLGIVAVVLFSVRNSVHTKTQLALSTEGVSPSTPAKTFESGNQPDPITFSPDSSESEVLTGEVAKEELQKGGKYESLGAALSAARHAVEKIDPDGEHSRGAEYFAANPGEQLRAWFSGEGMELGSGIPTKEGEEPWSLKLRLKEAGRAENSKPVGTGEIVGNGGRMDIKHVNGVTQWYENSAKGLEQGFTFYERPDGTGDEVEVVLGFEGSLRAKVDAEGDEAWFVDTEGIEVVHYHGLKAWDATGKDIAVRLESRGPDLALVANDAGAQYPVTIDPWFAHAEALLEGESFEDERFGTSVALDGGTALVGAHFNDTVGGIDAGTVYAFAILNGRWSLQGTLTASDGASGDFFGYSVSVDGDTALIGTPGTNGGVFANDNGSAYVFVRSDGTWSEQDKLIPSDGDTADWFGSSVSVDGDTALIGAWKDDDAGFDSGSAYVFVRSGGTWSEQEKLTASDGDSSDNFGFSVSVDGNTALIGAHQDDDAGSSSGSAYVFVRSGDTWSEQHKLTASDGASSDYFGYSVSVDGDTALIGAYRDDDAAVDSGSAYVYVSSNGTWSEQQKLTASDGASYDNFGSSVALSRGTALIGAFLDDTTGGVDAGSAYVFTRSEETWTQQAQVLADDGAEYDNFGVSVAIDGNFALIGAFLDDGDDTDSGSGYLFYQSGGDWTQREKMEIAIADQVMGTSVALDGDTALVGAYLSDTVAGIDAGTAYVFLLSNGSWSLQGSLTASDGAASDFFGHSVSVDGDTALIGTPGDNREVFVNDSGSAYVFVRSGGTWSEQEKLTASDDASRDYFGHTVSVDGETALIGAWGDDDAGTESGSAYVFVRSDGTWSEQEKLTASDSTFRDNFGFSVSVDGDTALIGAYRDDDAALDSGSAYVFVRSGDTWSEQEKLTASDGASFDRFGYSVNVDGDTAFIGAHGDDDAGSNSGSAYVFVRSGDTWSEQQKLTASDGAVGDFFGYSVSVDGDTALVGAPVDPFFGYSGSAYLFVRSGTLWSQQVRLSNGIFSTPEDKFGQAVALSGNTALVGLPGFDDNRGTAVVFVVGQLPEITQQPQFRTVVPGQPVTFTIAATGYDLTYQWRKDGVPIDGATSTTLDITVSELQAEFDLQAGRYDCLVTNIGGTVTSAAATLTVNDLSEFTRVYPGAPPEAQGFAIVNLSPPEILSGWRFVGEQEWRASGVPVGGLATGDREIEFRPVSGYIHPPTETVGIVSGAAATVLDRIYFETESAGTGGVTVTLKPDDITSGVGRAQWRLLGEDDSAWRDSGATLGALPPGAYLIECKPFTGRATPPNSNVLVSDGQTTAPTITYFLEGTATGELPAALAFETVTVDTTRPYAFVGQIRSNVGSSTGFAVKERVVATAAHVVWDEGTLSAVEGLQWLHQRHGGTNEPTPQNPRGFYLLSGYAAQRQAEGTPGSFAPESRNLDVAAMYFTEDAARGGYSGFLASDLDNNEFLLSESNKQLVGYPVDGISAGSRGRMHATTPANVIFSPVGATANRTFLTTDIRSTGGSSGGPLCVQFEGGAYYPAAIYLGGNAQSLVRSIDSAVIDLFDRAELSGIDGEPHTGGGITHTSVSALGGSSSAGALSVVIQPAGAAGAGGWRLRPENGYRSSGSQKNGLNAGNYVLEFATVNGYQLPASQQIKIKEGKLKSLTFAYALEVVPAVEINVTGNGRTISDGDVIPSAIDHTDFGVVDVASGELTRTFSIVNTGNIPLSVGSIQIGGAAADDFVVSVAPGDTVPPGGSTNFQVTFDPSAQGARSASLSFATNDLDENPYDFSIQGNETTDSDSNGFSDVEEDGLSDLLRTFLIGEYVSLDLSFLRLGGTETLDLTDLPPGLVYDPTTGMLQGTITGKPGGGGTKVNKMEGTGVASTVNFPMSVLFPARISVSSVRAFSKTRVKKSSKPQVVVIGNGGEQTLEGVSVLMQGKAKKDYRTTNPSSAITPGGSTSFKITFRPRKKGRRKATVIVNSKVGLRSSPLSGKGK